MVPIIPISLAEGVASIVFKYVLPALLILGLLGWGGFTLYSNGYTNGSNAIQVAWDEDKIKLLKEQEERTTTLRQALQESEQRHQRKLQEITQNAKQAEDKLNSDIADLRKRKLYVTATATRCNSPGTGEEETASLDGGGPARVELPEKTSEDLIGLVEDAQETVIMYNRCRAQLVADYDIIDGPLPSTELQ